VREFPVFNRASDHAPLADAFFQIRAAAKDACVDFADPSVTAAFYSPCLAGLQVKRLSGRKFFYRRGSTPYLGENSYVRLRRS
jgi:hypothetical protein